MRGLALGDAFGERWFAYPVKERVQAIADRRLVAGVWPWTDDTAMALSVVHVLREFGRIDRDTPAQAFATTFHHDPHRKYGSGMRRVLRALHDGADWREVTVTVFDGQGSWGNGAAMRVAPLGVWFADDLDAVVDQAHAQAVVTHAHPEAAAGAIAVAVAAAANARGRDLLPAVLDRTPEGEVAAGLRRAERLSFTLDPRTAANELGRGRRLSAVDTVPYAVWCAARHPDDLIAALWATASAGGDVDTTCAIVGGIVAPRAGSDHPPQWTPEPLPDLSAASGRDRTPAT
ncbi:ADP-ribosylglycohydrolase family protein [Saccharothrix violaceirubra]